MNILSKFELYLEENYSTGGEKNTIKAYYSDIMHFLKYFKEHFGEDIVDFSRADVSEYKKYLKEEKQRAYTTINRKIASLSIYENFLLDEGIRPQDKGKIIKKNDFYKIERPFITADKLPRKTIKKIRLHAGRTNERDYLIMVLLDEAGVRVTEVCTIELKNVNFDRYEIIILGKGEKVRSIFINNIILDALNNYLPEREKILNGRKNKYLIISQKTANSNKPMTRQSINNLLDKYCMEIKGEKVTPHTMRHNAATTMYEEGKSDMVIKKTLGQTSNITDIYVHTGEEKFRNKTN